jgi:hypothetical protein
MSKRTFEDVERERTLQKISRDVEAIKDNTRPMVCNPLTGIVGGLGSPFRPLRRKLLSHKVNRVIDFAFTIIAITGLISFIKFDPVTGEQGFISVGYGILMFLVGVIGMASSPKHDEER